MNGAVVILIHKIVDNEVVSTVKQENNASLDNMVVQGPIKIEKGDPRRVVNLTNYDESKLCLNVTNNCYLPDFTNSLMVKEVGNEWSDVFKFNFPTLIKCQNCETNFPTKYQYQRHQCDFDINKKSPLKSYSDEDDGERKQGNHENNRKDAYECAECCKVFPNKITLERHQECCSDKENTSNVCEYCGKQFVSENRLRIHKENHCKKAGDLSKFYRSDVTVWKCKKCHEVFSSMQNATHHVSNCQEIFQLENGKLDVDSNEWIETITTEILLQCEFCNRTFSDKNLLLMHQRKHTTTKNYECIDCNKTFDSYTFASSHWMKKCSEHTNLFYLPKMCFCEYCDRTFKSHEILYNHKIKKKHYTPKLHIAINMEREQVKMTNGSKEIINRLIHDVLKTLEVPMISKESTNGSSEGIIEEKSEIVRFVAEKDEAKKGKPVRAEIHLENDKLNKIPKKRKWYNGDISRNKKCSLGTDEGFKYQCERCIKVFNSISSLETHRSSEHVATFCCEECGQTLGSAKALLIHCRAHKSLKPYVCDTCGRSYSQTSHLWQHMRFHQGIKPFACPHEGCDARYTIRPDLKDHIRKVHTRERPFKCNVCNKCFLTGSVYYQHRLIHTNDRRYGCDICQKRFFRADALNNHKRIHTDERPYPCHVCGREFRQKGDRNKHVRTQHPNNFNSNSS